MAITVVVDCTGSNLAEVLVHVARGTQLAGYTTGSDGIAWTSSQFNQSPAPVRICQDAGATDYTADVLDVETGAATIADIATWLPKARASYADATRPGQREPMIYCSASNLTPVANELVAAGLTDVPIWEADYNFSQSEATTAVEEASGPFPITAFQFDPDVLNLYDVSIFSSSWLSTVSKKAKPATPVKVPNVIGRTDLSYAESLIKAVGLVPEAAGDSGAGNKGRVTAQSPAAGTTVDTGTKVTLTYTVTMGWVLWPASVELEEGDTGNAVKVLQTALRNSKMVGVRGIAVDGDFGPQTLTAVRNFQASKGLTVDGIAGPETRAALVALNDL